MGAGAGGAWVALRALGGERARRVTDATVVARTIGIRAMSARSVLALEPSADLDYGWADDRDGAATGLIIAPHKTVSSNRRR